MSDLFLDCDDLGRWMVKGFTSKEAAQQAIARNARPDRAAVEAAIDEHADAWCEASRMKGREQQPTRTDKSRTALLALIFPEVK